MKKVVLVKVLDNYCLDVTFSDNVRGSINLTDRLFGPVFEPLKDPKLFMQATIDEFGVICWPNGADLAPDALYERLKEKTQAA